MGYRMDFGAKLAEWRWEMGAKGRMQRTEKERVARWKKQLRLMEQEDVKEDRRRKVLKRKEERKRATASMWPTRGKPCKMEYGFVSRREMVRVAMEEERKAQQEAMTPRERRQKEEEARREKRALEKARREEMEMEESSD